MVIREPSNDLVRVRKVIDDLVLSDGGTDLRATFEKVNDVLDTLPSYQKEVVFLTDMQAASWRPPEEAAEALKAQVARLEAKRPRSVVIDLGKSAGENRAVTGLVLGAPVVTVGTPVLIRATVRNFGATRADGVRVRVTDDGRLGPEEPVELAPGDEVPVIFRQQFSTPGDHVVEVSIDSDPLERDNRRWLVVPVRESLNVLLVYGHFKSEPYQTETDYLADALAPGEESPGQPRPIKVEVVSESALSRRELAPYDVVVLCNVGQFSPSEVTALDDLLKQGGGVVVFTGDQVVSDNYNRLLYDDGKGLLPMALGPSKEGRFYFNPLGFRHPIVAAYQGETEPVTAGLTQAVTSQYHRLIRDPKKGSPAEVALAFDTGDPAIVEAHRHRGMVFLVATSADTGWTNWPIHKSYVPVMQEMVLRAAAGKLSDRNILVGQPFDESFAAAGAAAPVTVVPPRGQTFEAKLQSSPSGGVSQLHFEQTDAAGEYKVKVGPPLVLESAFAANTDPAESDLAKLDKTRLTEILPGWHFQYLLNSKELARDASSVGKKGELHRPLLYGLLILLLLESILAWKFGHHESSS